MKILIRTRRLRLRHYCKQSKYGMSAFKNNVSLFFGPKNADFTNIQIFWQKSVRMSSKFAAKFCLAIIFQKTKNIFHWVAIFAAISIFRICHIFATCGSLELNHKKWLITLHFWRLKASKFPKGARYLAFKVVFLRLNLPFWNLIIQSKNV